MMMPNNFQTGKPTTLMVFVGICLWTIWGIFRVVYQHDHDGWLQIALCVLAVITFHQRFHKDSEMP
jgi:hypothetical protein